MTYLRRRPFCRTNAALAVLAVLILPSHGSSQARVPAAEDATIELSPFVISATEDVGYSATSTLSGSRIRTPLADVGASITVVTKDFLADTGSTDLRDVLVYTAGTEVTGVGGNLGGSGIATEQPTDTTLGNTPTTRLRGLAAADLTRGYFRSLIPFDRYNASRLEINRGANAILFGVGSPAGIINYTPYAAELGRDSGEVEQQVGRFGSQRTSLDLNKVLLGRQVAVRVAALRDREEFQQNPAFNLDRRIYGAAALSPDRLRTANGMLSGTTLRFAGESGDVIANNPRSQTPQDRLTFWFEPTDRMRRFGVPARVTNDVRSPVTGNTGLATAQNLTRSPIIHFPDEASPLPAAPLPGGPAIVGRQWTIASSVPAGSSIYMAPTRLPDALRRAGDPDAGFFVANTLSDASVFDFRNQLIDGPNKRENSDFSAINIALEQRLLRDRAGLELAYDRQRSEEDSASLLDPTRATLTIDVNTTLNDGSPNPHFGRPMTHFRPTASHAKAELETLRLTAFGELDFATIVSGGRGRWLGRHIASVLVQEEDSRVENRSGRPYYLAGPYPYGSNQDRFSDAGKAIDAVHYLGPSLASAGTAAGAAIPAIQADRRDLAGLVSGRLFALRRQTANQPFDYLALPVVNARPDLADNAATASKDRRRIDSLAFNLQSYLLANHVVGSAGWRRERVDTYSVAAPVAPGGENHRLVSSPDYVFRGTPDQSIEENLVSWSLVARAPRPWLDRVPGVSGCSLFFNESENLSPPAGTRYSAAGALRGPPEGSTRDYGFQLGLLDERLVVRVNRYETLQSGVTESSITSAINSVVSIHQIAYNAVREGYAPNSGNGFPVGYVPPPQELLDLYRVRIDNGTLSFTNPGVVGTTDFLAEGTEIEVVFNPTRNWTLAANAARQQSVRSNSGADAARLFYDTPVASGRGLVPTWLEGTAIPLFQGAVPGGSGTLADWTQRNVVNPFNAVRLQDNGPARELREWRCNLVANYRFRGGRLDGISLGGSLRWQDRVAIGFPLTNAPSGARIIDVTQPYLGPTEFNADAWIGYERKLWRDRVTWRLQLNVRNVLGEDDLIPIYAQPTGEAAVFRVAESRVWTVSSRFSF